MTTKHSSAACKVCSAIQDNPDKTNVEIGRLAQTTESSVRRHREPGNPSIPDTFFSDVPDAIITSRGRSIRTESGWEKITYRPQDMALLEANAYDDLERAIAGFVTPAATNPAVSPCAEVFAASDFQIGKANETGGGTKETVERVLASVARFKERVLKSKPRTIIITDIGDGIENIWNVPNHQLTTNDLDLMAQMRTHRRLYIEIFKELAPLAPECISVAVPSNHGQVRNAPGSSVGNVDNDFGIEVSHQLEDVCKHSDSEALRNIRFVRPDQYQETAALAVAGTKLAFNHGHRTSGGQNGHDKWWAAQDHGRMPGWDADMLVVGHYHSMRVEQSGDGRWILSVSASEPSSDYFALSTGKKSKRGVTCFRVCEGIWSDLEIL